MDKPDEKQVLRSEEKVAVSSLPNDEWTLQQYYDVVQAAAKNANVTIEESPPPVITSPVNVTFVVPLLFGLSSQPRGSRRLF